MRAHGVVPVTSWAMARAADAVRRVDALFIDASLVDEAQPEDLAWLRDHFYDGAVVVGLGVEPATLAEMLDLPALLEPPEASGPVGPTGYHLVHVQVLAPAEELEKIASAEELAALRQQHGQDEEAYMRALKARWVEHELRGKDPRGLPGVVSAPMSIGGGMRRGDLASDEGIDGLFISVRLVIQGNYEEKLRFEEELRAFREGQP